jgi:predicted GNAT family N-acyltransferase
MVFKNNINNSMDSGLIFRKYEIADAATLTDIYISNIPLYFDSTELPEFEEFLRTDALHDCNYDVVIWKGKIIGAGGIAMNEDGRVVMCFGLIDRAYHKMGFGKELLIHRIDMSRKIYPGKAMELDTSQHTYGFFEKYGFKTTEVVKDHWAPGLDMYKMIST